MPLRLVSVTLDAPDPAGRAAFWAGPLDRDGGVELADPDGNEFLLRAER